MRSMADDHRGNRAEPVDVGNLTMDSITAEYDEAWRLDAVCTDLTSDQFFLVGDDLEGMRKAQQICATCPVQEACLEFALETNQTLGIWGGTTPNERRRLRREWIRKAS